MLLTVQPSSKSHPHVNAGGLARPGGDFRIGNCAQNLANKIGILSGAIGSMQMITAANCPIRARLASPRLLLSLPLPTASARPDLVPIWPFHAGLRWLL